MCIFSGSVEHVANTNILVLKKPENRQLIAYQMEYASDNSVAMILPIPSVNKDEDAVSFINLESKPKLFKLLNDLVENNDYDQSKGMMRAGPTCAARLKVVDVGSFEASYVPNLKDMNRLDERFRLPTVAWRQVPEYKGFGFVVAKLKPGEHIIHPLAFEYEAFMSCLFYPTLHIHDADASKISENILNFMEDFDHFLFTAIKNHTSQHLMARNGFMHFSNMDDNRYTELDEYADLLGLTSQYQIFRRSIKGSYRNTDVLVNIGA